MRIAVLEKDKCHPQKCSWLCVRVCPINRTGAECIVQGEDKKALISEELCTGCGICIHKCPFAAIHIINLPEELETPVHRFGENSFRLYRLPIPKEGKVLGLVGANGVGKTTAIKILAGEINANLGDYESKEEKDLSTYFRGSELQAYFERMRQGIRTVTKPQYVDMIPRATSGTVEEIIERIDERGAARELSRELGMEDARERDVRNLSGGELQRLAIIAAMVREADIYLFDEPSSYLDISQRLKAARTIRELAVHKSVIIVEHDLAVLDYLSDYTHIFYGTPAAYGIVSAPYSVRVGINTYLGGFIREENVRFRDSSITFSQTTKSWQADEMLLAYPSLTKKFPAFALSVEEGVLYRGEVVGVVGPNATGKSTFVQILARVTESEEGFSTDLRISYKPQYLQKGIDANVEAHMLEKVGKEMYTSVYKTEVLSPLELEPLFTNNVSELSGGELQRIHIAICVSQDADIYLLDEPSAYLDVEQRLACARLIRRRMESQKTTALVVEHDIVSVDYLSDRLIVFEGVPSVEGHAAAPAKLKEGMNRFLRGQDITFRREPETGRPRANKHDSQLDHEQKEKGEYYYRD